MGVDCVDFEMDSRVADYVGDKSRDSVVRLVYLSRRGYASPIFGTYDQDREYWNRSAVRGKGTEVVGGTVFTVSGQTIGGSLLPRRWEWRTTPNGTISFAAIRDQFEKSRAMQLNFKTVFHIQTVDGTGYVDAAHNEFLEYHKTEYPDNEIQEISVGNLANSWLWFITPAVERFFPT